MARIHPSLKNSSLDDPSSIEPVFSTPWCSPAPWGWAAMVSGVWGDAPSASGVAVPCGRGLGKSSSLIFWPSWEGCRGLCSWLWHRRQELRLESKSRWIKCWRGRLVPTKPSRPPLSSSWLRLQPRLRWMAFQGSPASHHCFSLYSCRLVAPSGLASCICFLMQIQQWGCVGVGREGTRWNRTSQCESGAEGEQGQRIPPWPLLPLLWELVLRCGGRREPLPTQQGKCPGGTAHTHSTALQEERRWLYEM